MKGKLSEDITNDQLFVRISRSFRELSLTPAKKCSRINSRYLEDVVGGFFMSHGLLFTIKLG